MCERLKHFILVETIIILLFFVIRLLLLLAGPRGHESYTEYSPSGDFFVIVHGCEKLGFPIGDDSYSIALYGDEDNVYRASMHVRIPNGGKKARYEINWKEEYVEIVFEKQDKSQLYYRLPLKECE